MKKKFIISILVFCVFFGWESKAYGFVKKDFMQWYQDVGGQFGDTWFAAAKKFSNLVDCNLINVREFANDTTSSEVLQELQEYWGYEGDELHYEMILNTYIKIVKVDQQKEKYKIQFGEKGNIIKYGLDGLDKKEDFKIEELIKYFGLNEKTTNEELHEGYTWDARIVVKGSEQVTAMLIFENYILYLKSIYTQEDMAEADNEDLDESISNASIADSKKKVDVVVNGYDDAIKTLKKWLGTNIGGAIAAFFAHIPRTFGDIFQYWANIIQTLPDGNAGHFGVTYKFNEITTGDAKEYNKYINAGGDDEETFAIKTVNIKKDKNNNGTDDFKTNTPIPYIITDWYTVGMGYIDYFDINFLTGNKSTKTIKDENGNDVEVVRHESNSIWMKFRNIVSGFIRLSIYATALILLVGLIWSGFNIVRHTYDNPAAQVESKKIIEKLMKATFALIGTILVMGGSIFANEEILSLIGENDTYELPIRVNVEDVYSFSTTFAGYARYLSTTSDPDQGLQIIGSAFEYMFFALANLGILIIGVVRVFMVWILSVWGPIMSIRYVLGKQNKIDLEKWAFVYVAVVFIQIPIALLGKLAINIA